MAEVAGVVLAGINIAVLFNSCVECIGFIQVARDAGDDQMTALIALCNARLKLSRWGEAVGLSKNFQKDEDFTVNLGTEEQTNGARLRLNHILTLIQKARKKSDEAMSKGIKGFALPQLIDPHDPQTDFSGGEAELCLAMESISFGRQGETEHTKVHVFSKVTWALRDKKQLGRLIEDIISQVNGLVELFPASLAKQEELRKADMAQLKARVADQAALDKLEAIAKEQDSISPKPEIKAKPEQSGNYTFSGSNNHGFNTVCNSGYMNNSYTGKES